jgi:hypothetical protein
VIRNIRKYINKWKRRMYLLSLLTWRLGESLWWEWKFKSFRTINLFMPIIAAISSSKAAS